MTRVKITRNQLEGTSRLRIDPMVAILIRIGAKRYGTDISSFLRNQLKTRKDYPTLLRAARAMQAAEIAESLAMAEAGIHHVEHSEKDPTTIEIINENNVDTSGVDTVSTQDTKKIPTSSHALVEFVQTYLEALTRHNHPSVGSLSPLDIAALEEVHTSAMGLTTGPKDAQTLYERWVEAYVSETEDPKPKDLLVNLYRYVGKS